MEYGLLEGRFAYSEDSGRVWATTRAFIMVGGPSMRYPLRSPQLARSFTWTDAEHVALTTGMGTPSMEESFAVERSPHPADR